MKKLLLATFPVGAAAALYFWFCDNSSTPAGNLFADRAGLVLAFGRLAGIIAALGIMKQLLLISRAKWLEPLFGLDRLTRFHHLAGLLIPIALLAHPVLIVRYHAMQTGNSFIAQYLTVLGWEDVLAAACGALLIISAVILSLPFARRRLSYEAWHNAHLASYLGLALAVGHQFALGGDLSAPLPYFARTWYALYAFALGNLAWGRVFKPLWLYRKHRFVVEKIVPETTEAESVWITGCDMASLPAEAGQFALLRFWAPGFRSQAHPFSISKPPDGNYLRFTIKKSGDFTASVHNSLKPGTPVLIDGPHGVFTEKKCLGDKALFIAGGIGITPLRSLGERLRASGKDCVLLYANRAQKDIVFRRELEELEDLGGFTVDHILSADPEWPGEKGHIDAGRIKRLVPDFAERDAFLCGPPPMMTAVTNALISLGVSRTRIHSELFSL
ncbi:MAG: ferric reductase-like transmembrane domain-containing protein [Elusimicrobiales bacterium]|jgi:predicted ferric reductase